MGVIRKFSQGCQGKRTRSGRISLNWIARYRQIARQTATVKEKDLKNSEQRGVTFLPASGSIIGGMAMDKTGRITEAMKDIQLSIDGLRIQLADEVSGERFATAAAAFARSCSVFLRKIVLGDFDRRKTRLLDDQLLDQLRIRFHRQRRIPQDKRRRFKVGFGINGVVMKATKLNDKTLEPEKSYSFHGGSQSVEVEIEWPLPGVAKWTEVPSEETPWLVDPDQLFQLGEKPNLSCDQWLGQQVVLFDGKGISLKKIIQTVVNFEGAHTINTSRLFTVEDEKPSKAAANPAPHILNAITFFGIRYAHLVVIESAMYLYNMLLDQDGIKRPDGEIYSVKLGVECTPAQAESPDPAWARFQGSMAISFSNAPKLIRHEIKAVK